MKLPIVIYIEPKDATECGKCPRVQLDGSCGAFEDGGTDRETVYDDKGEFPLWDDEDSKWPTMRMKRLSACIAADERAHASGLLGEEASTRLMELMENPPEPTEALKALYAEIKEESKHGRTDVSHKRGCLCGGETRHDEEHDAYYCSSSGVWLESKCSDSTCTFCKDRPEKRSIL